MSNKVEIRIDSYHVGKIIFNEAPQRLHAVRTCDGVQIMIPATLELHPEVVKSPCLLLNNLHGSISIYAADQRQKTKFADIRCDNSFDAVGPRNSVQATFYADSTLSALACLEKIREGQSPSLDVQVKGEICHLYSFEGLRPRFRTEPIGFYDTARVKYSTELWVEMLRSVNVTESVYLEIPLTTSPPDPWDKVWSALLEARDAFERGGSTGWKGCVSAVRLALEKWRDIEGEDMGPGWTSPPKNDRESRTKAQRIDNLRWHLMQCAHLAPHSDADGWNREDAVLMLSTAAALLSVRKP